MFITEIDECALNTDDCDDLNGECIDTPDGFECTCKPDFTGDGKNCTGIN